MRRVVAALLAAPLVWAMVPSTAAFADYCVPADVCLKVGKSTNVEYNPRSERAYHFVDVEEKLAFVGIFSKSFDFLDETVISCDAQHPFFKFEKHQAGGFIKVTCQADKS